MNFLEKIMILFGVLDPLLNTNFILMFSLIIVFLVGLMTSFGLFLINKKQGNKGASILAWIPGLKLYSYSSAAQVGMFSHIIGPFLLLIFLFGLNVFLTSYQDLKEYSNGLRGILYGIGIFYVVFKWGSMLHKISTNTGNGFFVTLGMLLAPFIIVPLVGYNFKNEQKVNVKIPIFVLILQFLIAITVVGISFFGSHNVEHNKEQDKKTEVDKQLSGNDSEKIISEEKNIKILSDISGNLLVGYDADQAIPYQIEGSFLKYDLTEKYVYGFVTNDMGVDTLYGSFITGDEVVLSLENTLLMLIIKELERNNIEVNQQNYLEIMGKIQQHPEFDKFKRLYGSQIGKKSFDEFYSNLRLRKIFDKFILSLVSSNLFLDKNSNLGMKINIDFSGITNPPNNEELNFYTVGEYLDDSSNRGTIKYSSGGMILPESNNKAAFIVLRNSENLVYLAGIRYPGVKEIVLSIESTTLASIIGSQLSSLNENKIPELLEEIKKSNHYDGEKRVLHYQLESDGIIILDSYLSMYSDIIEKYYK